MDGKKEVRKKEGRENEKASEKNVKKFIKSRIKWGLEKS